MNAVRWGPSGRMFASGGSDRKLKLWEVRGGMLVKTSNLPGLITIVIVMVSYCFSLTIFYFSDLQSYIYVSIQCGIIPAIRVGTVFLLL